MKRPIVILCAVIVAIAFSFVFYMVHSKNTGMPPISSVASSTPVDLSGQAIFTDGEHGFSIVYPEKYQTDPTFATSYHLPATWRVNALPNATGTPIFTIISYRIKNDSSYPRYFDAEVRIGASSDPKELARCEKPATDQNEQALPDVTLGTTKFKVFSFGDAAMMQYEKGISYRVVHDSTCIAIEQLQTGSSYRDDPATSKDVSDADLQKYYADLDTVVKSFSFSRP
ncbi:MAG: hypothetical protein JWL82_50 [Parcubacteria group bacterium]|nr:hypothetical protein [Parcubacteria group bacterium]